MKNNKKTILPMAALAVFSFIPQIVYADSSWYWISEQRPFDLLPCAAVATIAIEVLSINFIPRINHIFKTLIIVTLANLLSFVLPYLIEFAESSWYGSFDNILDAGPSYIVNIVFLMLTLAAELPIVYNLLKRDAASKKVLMWTIILSNIVTTIMVLIIERNVCYGAWA